MLLVMYFLICFMEEKTLTLELIFFICFAFWIDFFKLKKTVVVWSLSHVQHWNLKGRSTPSSSVSSISQSLLELIVIESVMLSNHLILCCPFLLFPSVFPSMRVFSNESALCIRRPKYGSFRFSINPSNVYIQGSLPLRLISFPYNPKDSQESSPAPQFKSISAQPSLSSNWHICIWLLE